MTKKEAVRRTLQVMGKDAKPAQMQPYIKEHFGIDMTTAHITTAKGEILRGKAAAKKATPKQPAAKPQPAKASPAQNGVSLQDLQAVKELVGRVGPDTLRSLIDLLAR